MQCPDCHADVPEGSTFCVNCGRSLGNTCPSCGAAYTRGNRYCRTCGAQLPGGAGTAPTPTVQTACPRCHSVNEPGAAFCFSCGLPFDEERRPHRATVFAAGRPAGFWIRVVAALIDGGVLFLISLVVGALWPGASPTYFVEPSYEATSPGASDLGFVWTTLDTITVVLDAAYYTLAVAIWSTTIGKRVVGIYVFRPDGSRLGVMRAFCRYLAGFLSAFLLFIGYLMIAFRRDKRGLHDLICDTVVVFRR